MTIDQSLLLARPATPDDRQLIRSLMRSEGYVHTHLDWKPVEDWLGDQPFLIAEHETRSVGALACPPAPADTAWLRFFAVVPYTSIEEVWHRLWPQARKGLEALEVKGAAALSLDGRLDSLYQAVGFEQTHNVVVLNRPYERTGTSKFSFPFDFSSPRDPSPLRQAAPREVRGAGGSGRGAGGKRFGFGKLETSANQAHSPVTIRLARPAEYQIIGEIDTAAFVAPWQMTPELIRLAMGQSNFVTVAEVEGQIVGYQLSTPSSSGAHLARLAVRPEWQGRGIGSALVVHVIEHYRKLGAREITINTQDSNAASIRVYQRLGFTLTGMRFPVFQLVLR